jgi:hypothetical protein
VQRLTNGIVGQMRFQLAARDSRGFDAALLGRVSRLQGVQAAVPVIEQNANVVGPRGQQSVDLVGTDPHYAHLGGRIVKHVNLIRLGAVPVFTLPSSVVKQVGGMPLRALRLEIGSSSAKAVLVPELLPSEALDGSPIALAPLSTVQKLAGLPGRLTSIYVRSPPQLDRVVRAGLERIAAGALNVRCSPCRNAGA